MTVLDRVTAFCHRSGVKEILRIVGRENLAYSELLAEPDAPSRQARARLTRARCTVITTAKI